MDADHGPVTAERILDNLPPPLPGGELRARYGASMEYVRSLVHEAFARTSPVDVAVSAVRSAGGAVLRVLDHAADVVAEALQPQPAFAFATRSVGGAASAPPHGASEVRASRESGSLRLVVSIEPGESGQDVRVRLENRSGDRVSPMLLSVGDVSSGETFLSDKAFASGEALLRGVESGQYWIEAGSGDRSVEMSIGIEPADR